MVKYRRCYLGGYFRYSVVGCHICRSRRSDPSPHNDSDEEGTRYNGNAADARYNSDTEISQHRNQRTIKEPFNERSTDDHTD